METGKRVVTGKEMAKRFAHMLGADYQALL